MKKIILSTLAFAAASFATAFDFDFTQSEGFSAGSNALSGQQSWTASAGVFVNGNADKELVYVAGSNQSATYTGESFDPSTGTLTFTSDFKFNANPTANTDLMNIFRLQDTSGSLANQARVYFRYAATNDDFRLRYSTGNGFDENVYSTNVFTKADIGMSASDTQSDDLRMTWTFTKGSDASSWTSSLDLYNISTSTALDLNYSAGTTHTRTENVVVREAFNSLDSLEVGFQSGPSSGSVTAAHILSYSAVGTAVPEASTYALFIGFGAFIFVAFKRRTNR